MTSGNVKFVTRNSRGSETVLETMTRGRAYGVLNSKGNIGSIVYLDNEHRRSKRIDLDRRHRGMIPHTQHGYMRDDLDGKKKASRLTPEEKKMVKRVLGLWDNRKREN